MDIPSKTAWRRSAVRLLLDGQTHQSGHHPTILLLLLLLLMLLLSACASAPAASPPVTITTAPTSSSAATTSSNAAHATSNSGPSAELAPPAQQLFRVAWSEPDSLDPDHAQRLAASVVQDQLFAGLASLAPDQIYQPAVAASWQFNVDQTQLTFRLKDTQWSDGTPVTAGDFVYAFRRAVDPREAASTAGAYLGLIKGATELNTTPVSAPGQLQQALDSFGVKALDTRTLQLTLAQPASPFHTLSVLATTWPLRQDIITQYGDTWTQPGHLIGNGPFVLKSWARGSELTLAPNPHYYAGAPKLSRLSFKFAAAWSNYLANILDDTAVPPSELEQVRSDAALKQQIVQLNELGTVMIGFNLTRPPFNNPKVRQAFAAAIDRQTIVHEVLHDVGVPAYSFIPPGMPGHLSGVEAGAAAQHYDRARAKQLLAEAGYPNGKGFPPRVSAWP